MSINVAKCAVGAPFEIHVLDPLSGSCEYSSAAADCVVLCVFVDVGER